MARLIRSDSFKAFVENPIVLSAITSWFLAQVVKAAIMLLKTNRRNGREILATIAWRTGGMPSSHAALVSAMTTSVGLNEGLQSNLFAVAFFISLIIMRDAMGVRRSSGIQAKSLNSLGRTMGERMGLEYHPVKEVQGHAPLEVVIGALLGIFIAAAYAYL
ncbi:divergent PAP2 family protein [Treponema primitia]|uniref:divergent PAP2 family protein n=1 Tax=Treponema primitia TaxID=88058 RepID=UPI001E469113|nr:divergent PAP2 family protein [Treponema primitia]